jgi:hypothetical protein
VSLQLQLRLQLQLQLQLKVKVKVKVTVTVTVTVKWHPNRKQQTHTSSANEPCCVWCTLGTMASENEMLTDGT